MRKRNVDKHIWFSRAEAQELQRKAKKACLSEAGLIRDQFVTVKEQYGKTEGIQAYHGYLSFKETDISPEMAQKIGMEFANEVWGKRFQVVVTTHLNTKHLHCHFVINSISFVDGKHLWGEEKAWFKFRKVADRICEKYGLYYDPNPNRSKQSEYLTMKEKAGIVREVTLSQVICQVRLPKSLSIV